MSSFWTGVLAGMIGGSLARSRIVSGFLLGVGAGIYADQSYNVPAVSGKMNEAADWLRNIEQQNRKPDNGKAK